MTAVAPAGKCVLTYNNHTAQKHSYMSSEQKNEGAYLATYRKGFATNTQAQDTTGTCQVAFTCMSGSKFEEHELIMNVPLKHRKAIKMVWRKRQVNYESFNLAAW